MILDIANRELRKESLIRKGGTGACADQSPLSAGNELGSGLTFWRLQ